MTATQVQKTPTIVELAAQLEALTSRVEELSKAVESAKPRNEADREMTDEDAKRILNGDLKDLKHKDAASKLGLSYGQVYSARGEYTFKHISKELKASGWKNGWVKA